MLLYRLGPEGFYAATGEGDRLRVLYSDPFAVDPSAWELGRAVESGTRGAMAPVLPGKIVGVGRNFPRHAEEMGSELPDEPLLFLKSPSSVIGPAGTIVLPPESQQVDFEGEAAIVLRHELRRASAEDARRAILGLTCACDVTARDLQRREPTFARSKSFDTFCPLGPAIQVEPDLEGFELVTRVNGEERQRGSATEMTWPVVELLAYISRSMTLEPGDVVLTGTPAGVGGLEDGDRIEVEVSDVGILENRVEGWRQQ